jgi:hypothetical protein
MAHQRIEYAFAVEQHGLQASARFSQWKFGYHVWNFLPPIQNIGWRIHNIIKAVFMPWSRWREKWGIGEQARPNLKLKMH